MDTQAQRDSMRVGNDDVISSFLSWSVSYFSLTILFSTYYYTFPNFSHSCPSNPEEKCDFCLYLFCEGSAPDSSAKTVKCKERFNQVAPGNTCAMR